MLEFLTERVELICSRCEELESFKRGMQRGIEKTLIPLTDSNFNASCSRLWEFAASRATVVRFFLEEEEVSARDERCRLNGGEEDGDRRELDSERVIVARRNLTALSISLLHGHEINFYFFGTKRTMIKRTNFRNQSSGIIGCAECRRILAFCSEVKGE